MVGVHWLASHQSLPRHHIMCPSGSSPVLNPLVIEFGANQIIQNDLISRSHSQDHIRWFWVDISAGILPFHTPQVSNTVTPAGAAFIPQRHTSQHLRSGYQEPDSVQSDFHSSAPVFHSRFVPSQHREVWPSFPGALSACRTMARELISGAICKGK